MGNHRAERDPRRSTSATRRSTSVTQRTATPSHSGSHAAPGKRRAAAPQRPSRLSVLPSVPIIAGIAALAISAGGAVSAADTGVADRLSGVNAASAAGAVSAAQIRDQSSREQVVSRDSRRDAVAFAADEQLVEQAEEQAEELFETRDELEQQSAQQSAKIKANQWVLPLSSYRVSAGFGAVSYLWSSIHTGLDMSTPSGTPIMSVANGVVTSAGYDGSYGNKTVITLDDGTEIWYCHQTSFLVSVGDTVRGGEVIGTVGSTGNSTGPHLHLEVRPSGGGPVDPYDALVDHGLTP